MKKYLCMLGVLLFIFIVGTNNVEAREYLERNCVNNMVGTTCNPKMVIEEKTERINYMHLDIELTSMKEVSVGESISLKNGWVLLRKTVSQGSASNIQIISLDLVNPNIDWAVGKHDLGTFIFEKVSSGTSCEVNFVQGIDRTTPSCIIKNIGGTNYYYDKYGNRVNEEAYYSSCFKCHYSTGPNDPYRGINGQVVDVFQYVEQCRKVYCKVFTDNNRVVYYDKNGRITDEAGFNADCANRKICEIEPAANGKYRYYGIDGSVVDVYTYYQQCDPPKDCESIIDDDDINDPSQPAIKYFGKNSREIATEIEFIDECYINKCEVVLSGGLKYYFDKDDQPTDEAGYFKSCFQCSYYKNTADDDDTKPIYTGYIDDKGNKLGNDKAAYMKACQKFSCEVLSDGTHYDKDGNIVSEEDYLKSCFKCRREDGKYYDENGKETTEDNWKLMCEPHKCQYLGGKYFNDKGAIVTKAEYDKACTNPKTGDKETSRMYIYIFGGFALTVAMIFGIRKYSKIRNV